jgi:dUTP pyrophosphatase
MRHTLNELHNRLLSTYSQYFILQIKVVENMPNYHEVHNLYVQNADIHNNNVFYNNYIDAGFNLLLREEVNCDSNKVNKIDFGVKCSGKMICDNGKEFSSGYYMYPRSSTGSKTALRMANSVGIIDSGYRGNLMGCFDVITNTNSPSYFDKYTSLVQICAPSLVPIVILIVDDLDENTERGNGGFGSTGK